MDENNQVEYLLYTTYTWESEENLSTLNGYLLSTYNSQLMNKTEVIKLEDLGTNLDDHSGEALHGQYKCNVDLINKGESSKLCTTNIDDINLISNYQNESISSGDATVYTTNYAEEKPYKCLYCDMKFKRSHTLMIHVRIHTGEKPYKCKYCSKQFTQKGNLASHMRTHGMSSSDISAHMRTYVGEKTYKCLYCDKEFRKNHILMTHMWTHTGKKPYKCSLCDMQFTQKGNLAIHMKTHIDQSLYESPCQSCEDLGKPCFLKCKYCDKHCTHKSILAIHMRTHTGEKPYKCKYCNKCFARKHDLMNHSRTHTGETPYNCQQCGKQFTRRSYLSTHMKTHSEEKLYQCLHCEKKFTAKQRLDKHMDTRHLHTGEYCDKRLGKIENLVPHIGTNTAEKPCVCIECGKQFSTDGYLAAHMRSHTAEKLYEYQNVMEEEPDDEPYTCEYCDQQFTLTSAFVNHMRTH